MLNKMNLWTSTGTLVGIKIVNQQNFILEINLILLIQIIALYNNGSQMYRYKEPINQILKNICL